MKRYTLPPPILRKGKAHRDAWTLRRVIRFVRKHTSLRASELKGLNWLSGVPLQTIIEPVNRPDNEVDVIEPLDVEDDSESTDDHHDVYIMNPKHEDRASSFFAQPGVLAGKSIFLL